MGACSSPWHFSCSPTSKPAGQPRAVEDTVWASATEGWVLVKETLESEPEEPVSSSSFMFFVLQLQASFS